MAHTQYRGPTRRVFLAVLPRGCPCLSVDLGSTAAITKSILLAFETPRSAEHRPLPHSLYTLGDGILELKELLFGEVGRHIHIKLRQPPS